MVIQFIDLCSGIGGFHSGLMATGHYECVGHAEIDHTNTWDCIYKMRCEKAESTHIWVSCYGRYFRCIRTKFTNLEYKNTLKEYKSHEGWTWGFPHQLEYEPPITENRLFVVEKIFRNKVETINDRNNLINNPDPKFGSVLDDLFGDG